MSTMTNEEIEALRALVLRMSSGDWTADPTGYQRWAFEGGYLGRIVTSDGDMVYTGPSSFHALRGRTAEEAQANAEGIATLKTHALALLDEIARFRAAEAARPQLWTWFLTDGPGAQRYQLLLRGTLMAYLWAWGDVILVEFCSEPLRQDPFQGLRQPERMLALLRDKFGPDVPALPTPIPDVFKCA